MAIYAVGDIQGCYGPLMRLLEKARFDPAVDRLWCVGDMVNRGPDSLQVLRFMIGLGDAAVCVLGNHDLHLLEQGAGGKGYKRDTLVAVMAAPDHDELIAWLRQRPILHHDEALGWCMVHGGLHPGWTLTDAKARAANFESQLRGERWKEFCLSFHHAKFPHTEPADDRSLERMLFEAAVFTRSRYCTQEGRFNWDVRAGETPEADEKAWFAHDRLAWRNDCRVVYGHWAANGLVTDQPHVLGLDSGCVWGGRLTLARLDSGDPAATILSVACEACQAIS
ncbi:MAG TPA: symmetrical bis(5'-nucleosyl)-tetraphosphatase [Mariprofundaceae bacterium]|nr:symmetrical bis(5'-nucleosyl)-tetraphosphatase [Mariprofundaceae bacterium]